MLLVIGYWNVGTTSSIGKGGVTCNDMHVRNLRETRDDFLAHTIAEILLLCITTHVDKRAIPLLKTYLVMEVHASS